MYVYAILFNIKDGWFLVINYLADTEALIKGVYVSL